MNVLFSNLKIIILKSFYQTLLWFCAIIFYFQKKYNNFNNKRIGKTFDCHLQKYV